MLCYNFEKLFVIMFLRENKNGQISTFTYKLTFEKNYGII